MSKLVLLVEACPTLRRDLNLLLMKRGLEVWPVPDDMCAHQVINLEGARIAVAVIGGARSADPRTKALASRVREFNSDAQIVCGCAGATEDPRNGPCGGVIWPRTACPDVLADLVVALIQRERPRL